MGTTDLSRILRLALGVLGAISLLGGLALVGSGGGAAALWPLVIGIGLILVALYENGRYQAGRQSGTEATLAAGRIARFERTDEVFSDPTTGRLTRVWYDPTTGEREYRPEG